MSETNLRNSLNTIEEFHHCQYIPEVLRVLVLGVAVWDY